MAFEQAGNFAVLRAISRYRSVIAPDGESILFASDRPVGGKICIGGRFAGAADEKGNIAGKEGGGEIVWSEPNLYLVR